MTSDIQGTVTENAATVTDTPRYDATPDGQLAYEYCRQLAVRAPKSFEIVHDLDDAAAKNLPKPKDQAYIKCVAFCDGQQWLIAACSTIGPLSADNLRRRASEALKRTPHSRSGMNDAYAMFALMDGVPVSDPQKLFENQGRCEFCRAFRLLSSNI